MGKRKEKRVHRWLCSGCPTLPPSCGKGVRKKKEGKEKEIAEKKKRGG